MNKQHSSRPIRVGVVGVGRGQSFARCADVVGMKLVALCDRWKEKLVEVGKEYGVATYTDYDKFLCHDMDAVILANYFHEHAPFAIKALAAGFHVMSETAACNTLAEGVALCRAVEKSKRIYMFAENYPYTAFNQEMRRLYRGGEIGRVLYGEGEYNHPMSPEDRLRIAPGKEHWRAHLPSTYYCTHALAPLMHITDTMPVSVNALSIAAPDVQHHTLAVGDPGSVILCRMDNGAVFRLFGIVIPGHSIWYRLHGTGGLMESTRGPGYWGPGQIRIVHEHWNGKKGEVLERSYLAEFPELAAEARKSGHGGGDLFIDLHFARAIRDNKQPYLDVYRGVAMSVVGILAWKSALHHGRPIEVPDFKKECSRKGHEKDNFSPFPKFRGPGQPAPSILGQVEPKKENLAYARKVWAGIGYHGK